MKNQLKKIANTKCKNQVAGKPLFYLFKYIPVTRKENVSKREQRYREMLWSIKDGDDGGEEYKENFSHIAINIAYTIFRVFEDMADELMVVPIPASSIKATVDRWDDLIGDICAISHCEDGTGAILPANDGIARHLTKKYGVPDFVIDREKLEGKNVILVDDLIDTGMTMAKTIKALDEICCHVIACIAIAST